ncbi:MAG TPA: HEAT repeat domain-containing protein [Pirellulales bacterium]
MKTRSRKDAERMSPESLSQLLEHLGSPDPAARRAAAQSLPHLGDAVRAAAPALVDRAGDEDEAVQTAVTETLENLGPPDLAALPALIERLTSSSADVAYWAATLIGRLEADAAPATTALADALVNHSGLNARERAAWALGKIGPRAGGARAALTAAASAPSPRLSRLAQESLKRLGGNA